MKLIRNVQCTAQLASPIKNTPLPIPVHGIDLAKIGLTVWV